MGKNRNRKERHFAINISIGAGAAIVSAIILLMIAAAFTSSGSIPENAMKIVTVICCFISALTGSRFGLSGAKEKKLLIGACTGALMFIVVFAIGRAASADAMLSPLTLATLVSALLGGTLGSASIKRKKRVRR